LRFERVLALSPHTDDVELGAGGTVARLVEEGAMVRIIAFSPGKATTAEALKAGGVLGARVLVGPYPTRKFAEHRQSILQYLIDDKLTFDPDLVLCPSSFDFHQDHEVVRAEALRAFRTCTILGYELPWSCRQFDAQCLVRLLDDEMNNKVEAVEADKSQLEKPYTDALFIESLARVRGVQGGYDLAEAFEVIRWVL